MQYEQAKSKCLMLGMHLLSLTPQTVESIKEMSDRQFFQSGHLWVNGRKHRNNSKWYSDTMRQNLIAESIVNSIQGGGECLWLQHFDDESHILQSQDCTTSLKPSNVKRSDLVFLNVD